MAHTLSLLNTAFRGKVKTGVISRFTSLIPGVIVLCGKFISRATDAYGQMHNARALPPVRERLC